jgi:hypothetical protein
MQKASILVAAIAVAACGGSSAKLSGNFGGKAFTPAEVRYIPIGPKTCTIPIGSNNLTLPVQAIGLVFSSYANACADYATAQCVEHANAQNALVVIAHINTQGPNGTPKIAAGVYTLGDDPKAVTGPDNNNDLQSAFAAALGTGANCNAISGSGAPSTVLSVKGSTVTVDSISATSVGGTLDVQFQDGSTLKGPFTASACTSIGLDVCQLAQTQALCTGTPTCQ